MRVVRSALVGGASMLIDLAVLYVLVSLAHVSEQVANVPSLIAGWAAGFWGNRRWAFAKSTPPAHVPFQLAQFVVVELGAMLASGILFALVVPKFPDHFLLVRLMTSQMVFLLWSYPLYRHVFR